MGMLSRWLGRRRAEVRNLPFLSRPRGRGRSQWEGPFAGLLSQYVPLSQEMDFALYRKLREGIPVIHAAIQELKRLVGTIEIKGEAATRKQIGAFLRQVRVLGTRQHGIANWLSLHLDNLLMFGKAATEIVVEPEGTGVYGLKPLPTESLRLIPGRDGDLALAQQQPLSATPVKLDERFILYHVLQPQDSNPHGTPLLWSLPFVADIWLRMAWSVGKAWERSGAPSFHVNWEPPPEFVDPSGQQTKSVMQEIQDGFVEAMQSRKDVTAIKDFFSAGKVTITGIGTEGQMMEFEVPHRAIMEQIVSVTGLPPWSLGFSWSTTERLSHQQADKIAGNVRTWRAELQPGIRRLIEWQVALSGMRGEWDLKWSEVSLQDRHQVALAHWREAAAEARRLESAVEMWRQGFISQLEAAQRVAPELESVERAMAAPLPPAGGRVSRAPWPPSEEEPPGVD